MATGVRGTRARVATVLSLRWPATPIALRLTPLGPRATHGPAVLLHEGRWRYPDGKAFLRLWRSGRGLRADCARLGRFVVSPHGQHVGYRRDPAAAPAACEAYFFSALIALPLELQGALCLHASAVVGGDGLALVFVGASGAGKSTIAAHALRAGGLLAADDLAPLVAGAQGYQVLALPQWLRLAPRSAAQLGLISARRRGYDAAGGKTLIGARRWASRARPARAAVFVLERERSADPVRAGAAPALERLRGHAAWAVLAQHSLVAPLLRPLGREVGYFERLARLADQAPIFRLRYGDGLAQLDAALELARRAAEAALD